ncbi:ubiquitin-like modifier-activating enzyme Atg7p [[Candida] railenensis]|uniref:Ubiquitin-like modifier-activating enzyme ATG7 n=1 Tax=[Candida] railenensis TaxID=45579 RepID=A0A9P0VZT1_9ASCO|nr:ubiquitin-like modifier-activating enzyme Atg7p [[Candida] railenensis]
MTSSISMEYLKFAPVNSFVDSSFFTKLSELKLDTFKLDSTSTKIHAYFTHPNSLNKFNDKPTINLDYGSFDQEAENYDKSNILLEGNLHSVNTIEEFKSVDKQTFLKEAGLAIFDSIKNEKTIPDLNAINPFSLLTFYDLKKYKFYYWFAYPALSSTWYIVNRESEDLDVEGLKHLVSNEDNKLFFQFKDGEKHFELGDVDSSPEFVYVDTSLNELPSVQLKNYLYFLALRGFSYIYLTVFRPNSKSYRLKLKLKDTVNIDAVPKVLGWERTTDGKLGPKLADLGALINPKQLADQAVDLNIKLMKWRIAPDLDNEIIKKQKVLLLGAGTLGSYVARALMGWGVRKITFVDSGRVSYSNPVRQPLFSFKDCFSDEGRGEWKATRAAESLREIFPGVDSSGYNMEVPMIGHHSGGKLPSTVQANFDKLSELFDEHDAIFLLMDSREARWLPTVLGVAKDKIVINAAIGFDSYLVMRHGVYNENGEDYNGRLGCYYCNDLVAPDDSFHDRTLDQMCTVTRPGVALMASSLAVELLVSILQNPQGKHAGVVTDSSTVLGEVPHQIRGYLHSFQQTKLSSNSFKNCSACSHPVVDNFKTEGWEFISACLAEPGFLESVSGLTDLQKEAEQGLEKLMENPDDFDEEDEEWLS